MKQILLKTWLILVCLLTGAGTMWAEEVVYKTALFGSSYNSKAVSSYTGSFSATNDNFTVDIANFNNNNNGWDYVKTGNKTNASVGTITTNAAIDKIITKVTVTIDAVATSSVNSITLYSGTSASTCTTSEGTFTVSTGAQTVKISSPAANKFYKLSFDCMKGSSNGIVTVSKVEYYTSEDGDTPTPTVAAPTFSPAAGTYTGAQTITLTQNDASMIMYTTNGNDPSYENEVGEAYDAPFQISSSCTVKAIAIDDEGNESEVASAAYTIKLDPTNTQETAYTVEQAKAIIDNSAYDLTKKVYVKGTVSEIATPWSDQYNNITYNISADGATTGNQFQLYRCATNGAEVGDYVIAYGTLKKYNDTYEFEAGNTIVDNQKPAQKTITALAVSGTPTKTSYNVGDAFETAGLVVTATYSDETTATITTGFDWEIDYGTGNEALVAGATSVDVMVCTEDEQVMSEVYTVNGLTVAVPVTLTSIAVSGTPTKTEYYVGDTFNHAGLVATANYSDDTHVDVTETATWEVDPETFTTAGIITVTVSASFGGQEDIQEYEVTVNKKTASISFAPATIDVEVGKNVTLAPTTTPADAEISYSITEGSENVSIDGAVVTGVAEGTATICADFAGNGEYDAASTTVTINVIPADPSTAVTYNFSSFTSGATVELTDLDGFVITLNGNGGTNPAWSSSQARVYAKGTLTVKANNAIIKSIEYDYTVNANSKGKVPTIDGVNGKTSAGTWDTENKTWTGADKEVTFSTSGEAGNVGFTKLVIKYVENDNSDKIETSLTWSATEAEVKIGAANNTFPTLTTDPADLEGVTYRSSDINVAIIGDNGVITLVKEGEATITASYAGNDIYAPASSVSYTLIVGKATFVPTPAADGYETIDFTKIDPYKSLTTNQSVELTTQDAISFAMAFAKGEGSNAPKFYQNGNAVRAYTNNTMTITGAEPIFDVDIAWVSGYVDDAISITGLGTTTAVVTFSKTCRFTAITVLYEVAKISVTSAGYATYFNEKAYVMPAGLEGKVMKERSNGVASETAFAAGDVVPAKTALVLKGEAKEYVLAGTTSEGTAVEGNLLQGSITALDATAVATAFGAGKYYKLVNEDNGIGWYWGAEAGAAFAFKANKAYLVVPAAQASNIRYISIDGDGGVITGIDAIDAATEDAEIYNLQGQRVNRAQKGVYVVNGRKVIR